MIKTHLRLFASLVAAFVLTSICIPIESTYAEESVVANNSTITFIPELVITPTRVETDQQDIGRSIAVRKASEFETQEIHGLTDAVQSVSGVRMVDIGGPSKTGTTPFEIRGFRTGGTQMLLNGMTLNDPSSISGTYESFFSYLTVDDLERIEILKGSTGVLYGSDSQGGVINLIAKKSEPGLKLSASAEGGSFDTFTEVGFLNVGTYRGGVISSVTRTDTSGLNPHGNFEDMSWLVSGNYSLIAQVLSISPLVRIVDGRNDLDTSPAIGQNGELIPNQPTEHNHAEVNGKFAGVVLDYTPGSWFDSKGSVYLNDSNRDFFFDFQGFKSKSHFEGRSFNAESQNVFSVPSLLSKFIIGFDFEHQSYETDSDGLLDRAQRDQTALFLADQTELLSKLLSVSGGFRVTGISNVGKTITTLEGAVSQKIPWISSRIHSSIAEGFRAPTLFESSGKINDFSTGGLVTVGNKHLKPEEALSFDAGLEQTFLDGKVVLDTIFFQTQARETIIFDTPTFTEMNGGSAKMQGLESSILFRPTKQISFRSAYTNLDKAEGPGGLRRQRTPRNWLNVSAALEVANLTFSPEIRVRDSQELAFFGTPQRVHEQGVTIFNSALRYSLTKSTELFSRAENIFDVRYTEAGFRMPGASIWAGVKVKLE